MVEDQGQQRGGIELSRVCEQGRSPCAPALGKHQINQIDHLDLQEWIQGTLSKTLKNKTIRDIISNVRQVFRLYRTRMKVAHDPTEGLMVRLPDPEAPDPFTRSEIKQILTTPTDRTLELLMVQFMLWAGPRVSETIALAWRTSTWRKAP